MSLTVNTLAYSYDTARTPDSVRYTGPSNSLSVKDVIDLKRVAPKGTATNPGKGRSMIKMTRTGTDGTDPVGDGLVNLEGSFPVGMQASEIIAMIVDTCTFAITSEGQEVFTKQDVSRV